MNKIQRYYNKRTKWIMERFCDKSYLKVRKRVRKEYRAMKEYYGE